MKLFVFAVRDRASDSFGNPMFLMTRGQATRSFKDEVNNPESGQLFKHPEDYDLYSLGEFDTNTGEFNCGKPEQIVVGKDVAVQESLPLDKPSSIRRVQ